MKRERMSSAVPQDVIDFPGVIGGVNVGVGEFMREFRIDADNFIG
jgi:hypothetical protein